MSEELRAGDGAARLGRRREQRRRSRRGEAGAGLLRRRRELLGVPEHAGEGESDGGDVDGEAAVRAEPEGTRPLVTAEQLDHVTPCKMMQA